MHRIRFIALFVPLIAVLVQNEAAAEERAKSQTTSSPWGQFRGPNGQGLSRLSLRDAAGPMAQVWRVATPPGNSSPVILSNGSLVITSEENGQLQVICLQASDGSVSWSNTVQAMHVEKCHEMTSRAAPTAATDGTRVFSFFGSYGLIAHGKDGEELWRRPLAAAINRNGCAASPILTSKGLALAVDAEGGQSYVMLVDPETGSSIWRKERPHITSGWSTPVVWRTTRGEELVLLGAPRLESFDLNSGKLLWWLGGFPSEVVATPAIAGDLLIASAQGFGSVRENGYAPSWNDLVPLDVNNDGKIQKSELRPDTGWRTNKEIPEGTFGNFFPVSDDFDGMDQDKDGGLSKTEWDMVMGSISKFYPRNRMVAVRAGGTGDATSFITWESAAAIPHIPSPLAYANRIYTVHDGLFACRNAETGKLIYRERLNAPGQYLASPVIFAGELDARVMVASRHGILTTIASSDSFEVKNRIELKETISATPAIDGVRSRVYVRTEKSVYCFGMGDD